MKKLVFLGMMCLAALTMQAQRCAVIEFKAGSGISQADVDGISAIFITYFHPVGYTMVERTQIDQVIEEQGLQRSRMTESQMVRIGQILNVSKIVVGDINVVLGQYNIDARVINVETGTIVATEGAAFTSTSYRTSMQDLAQKLARKISVTTGNTSQTISSSTAQGYVDLGLPSGTRWRTYNATGFYDYEDAVRQFGNRLPSREQWEELKAECQWLWIGNGYKITGSNGNSIELPASGARTCSGYVESEGKYGNYWSSTPYNSSYSWRLGFGCHGVRVEEDNRCEGYSVRLIQR